jgi:hypothetical protein
VSRVKLELRMQFRFRERNAAVMWLQSARPCLENAILLVCGCMYGKFWDAEPSTWDSPCWPSELVCRCWLQVPWL